MKSPRKKVAYRKQGKRNPMLDIATPAGRRAKNLAANKEADMRLSDALGRPCKLDGQPLSGHLLKTIAASRLTARNGSRSGDAFEYAAQDFFRHLKYSWGLCTAVRDVWQSFIEVVASVDKGMASQFLRDNEAAFRWCLTGHVHRMQLEYEKEPQAIQKVEIWSGDTGNISIGVQNDGERRVMPHDRPPEHPALVAAGTTIHHFIAPEDLKTMHKIGHERFLKEIESGKRSSRPRPPFLVTEDAVLNVAFPDEVELTKVRRDIEFIVNLGDYKPKRRKNKQT